MQNTGLHIKYNKLTVISFEGKNKRGKKVYLFKCDCGNTKILELSSVKNNRIKSCGCLVKSNIKSLNLARKNIVRVDLAGKQFGRITAISQVGFTKTNNAIWLCKCLCGKTKNIKGRNLILGKTTSCGCYFKSIAGLAAKSRANIDSPWSVEIRQYISSAKKRNIDFLLTVDEFALLSTEVCKYCNDAPSMKCSASALKSNNILKNGIDRLNPKYGYTFENCVSCCSECNYRKRNSTFDEFINKTKQIYKNLKLDEEK